MDATGVVPQGNGSGITAEWVWDYFRDVDTLEPAKVVRHYTDDGQFRFANAEPARGKAAVQQMLEQFYGNIRDMKHRNTGLWLGDNTAVFEAEVTFTRKDGSSVTIAPAQMRLCW